MRNDLIFPDTEGGRTSTPHIPPSVPMKKFQVPLKKLSFAFGGRPQHYSSTKTKDASSRVSSGREGGVL
jgi:hypothetical protein